MALLNLRSFVEVYRSRSISAAARNLGLTQPAVSGHIASLEMQVGRALFVREPRGVSPTAFGEDLAKQIGESLDVAEEAFARAQARSSKLSGVVHIAGPAELMAEWVAAPLKILQTSGLSIRLHLGGKSSLYRKLIDGEVDLALTASTPGDPQLGSTRVGAERLIAVAAPNIAKRINAASNLAHGLKSEPLLAYDGDLPLIRTWLEANDLPTANYPSSITAPDLRMLRALIEEGAGWSVLPDYLCNTGFNTGQIARLSAPIAEPINALFLVWARSALRHPRVAYVQDLLLKTIRGQSESSDTLG